MVIDAGAWQRVARCVVRVAGYGVEEAFRLMSALLEERFA